MGYDSVVTNADLPYAETVTGTGNFAVSDTATDDLMRPEMPPPVQYINTDKYGNTPEVLGATLSTGATLAMVETRATKEEVQDFKDQINSSFEEIASMLNELQAAITFLNERLEIHNRRASHKI